MSTASHVSKLYQMVVDDVIANVKDAFLDDSVDEQVLLDLKQLWLTKLTASKALDPPQSELEQLQSAAQQEQAQASQIQQPQQFQVAGATGGAAAIAMPAGIFQQNLATLRPDGHIQNLTVQQTGNTQFIALNSIPSQLLTQYQPQVMQQMIPQQQQAIRLAQQQQPQPIKITQQLQQQQLQQQHLQQQQLHQQQLQQLQQQKLLQQGQLIPNSLTKAPGVIQIDGHGDTSSSDDDDVDFDDDDKDEEDKEEENEEEAEGDKEDPLNSEDDVSEDDPTELFDTENVVVCQYDKINRNKNKWKFHLKDGIMNLSGKDFVFQKASGDAEW
uniref:Transcription initiation factor IIA subunit 1 n=1 Tax=Biomphalaria glabrata TaxID=6526 RepID=A0A2C9LEN3_BIOGL